jgi:hypothetical protein
VEYFKASDLVMEQNACTKGNKTGNTGPTGIGIGVRDGYIKGLSVNLDAIMP